MTDPTTRRDHTATYPPEDAATTRYDTDATREDRAAFFGETERPATDERRHDALTDREHDRRYHDGTHAEHERHERFGGLNLGGAFFGWLVAVTEAPTKLAEALLSISSNKYVILAMINVLLLIVGCFMETTAILLIATPTLYPLIKQLGIDPVHFGLIMIVNLLIGTLTPPFGVILFIMQDIARGIATCRTVPGSTSAGSCAPATSIWGSSRSRRVVRSATG